jgi:preprotein translocase subunit SecY
MLPNTVSLANTLSTYAAVCSPGLMPGTNAPDFFNFAGVSFYLGGTSVLIIVVVLMDFMSQVQSHMMSNQYSSLLKKANLKNYNR